MSAVLDSIADNSGEVEDSLQLGSCTPFLLKLMEEDIIWSYLFTAEHSS